MSRKSLVLMVVVAVAFGLAFAGSMSFASDKGPAEITINPDGKKPVLFPHAKHQEKNPCGTCHHYILDGKRTPVDDATLDKIQACDKCHNADFSNEKLSKWKDIGHGLCKDCHTKMKAEGAPTKCNDCHIKK